MTACLLEEDLPELPPTPASCGNGSCETPSESCANCPQDCDCCSVAAAGGVVPGNGDTSAAVSVPDNVSVFLDELSDVHLSLASEWNDLTTVAKDFTIHGTVTSNDQEWTGICPVAANPGAFQVWVSSDGSDWHLIGFWTAKTRDFDISCGPLKRIRWIRIRGQPGAQGQLDAVTAKTGACLAL